MFKHSMLISLMVYLISCNSSDNSIMYGETKSPKPIQTKIGPSQSEAAKIKIFNAYLEDLSEQQLITAGEKDLHQKIAAFLPDTTVMAGYELHIREIGTIDTFRLIFHEYFDIYDDWSKSYLNVYTPSGVAKQTIRLWDLSFEGISSINLINNQIIEISYRDFFKKEALEDKAMIPEESLYLEHSNKVNDRIEGTVYEYYKIKETGYLKSLTKNLEVSSERYFPQFSAKLISEAELYQYNIEEVKLMKEEILAGYGYIFSDLPTQNYFELQNWYTPKHQKVENLLTDIEQLNLECLSKVLKEY